MTSEPTVYIVDDDPAVLKSLRWLIESAALSVQTLTSGESFWQAYDAQSPGCLVLDVRMPGMNGLELQRQLAEREMKLPVIVMTGHADVSTCAESFRNGAFDFIEKPADGELLIDRIREAITADVQRRSVEASRSEVEQRIGTLTPREMETVDLIVAGKTQKQIAVDLGISFQTAAKHRARAFEKLHVASDVELVRMLIALTLPSS